MPKVLEEGSNKFTTWLGNITAIPTEWIIPLFTISLGYQVLKLRRVDDKDQLVPFWKVGHIGLGNTDNESLYMNSMFFFRFMFPFWVGIGIRWAGKDPTKKEYLQTGLGWKLNGRLGALFRVQSDTTAARGVQGPNYDQSTGWVYGNK